VLQRRYGLIRLTSPIFIKTLIDNPAWTTKMIHNNYPGGVFISHIMAGYD